MNPSTAIVLLACFVFSALFSGVETGSYMINRIRLRHRTLHRRHSARVLAWVLRDPHIFIFTVLIGQNIAVYLLSRTVTDLFIDGGVGGGVGGGGKLLFGFLPWSAEMAATLTLMLPLFIFGEVAPKNLFRVKADHLMYRFADLLRACVLFFYPFTLALKRLFGLLVRNVDVEAERDMHRLSPDGLKEYFSAGAQKGVLSSHQGRMMENVTAMHRTPVRALMTSFKLVPTLPAEAVVADFHRLCAERQVAHVLLMRKHEVVGLVSLFCVANRRLADGDPLAPCAERIMAIEESRSLKTVFYRLRRHPRHSAVVVDTRRHPVGFVRLEDIARFIVGE